MNSTKYKAIALRDAYRKHISWLRRTRESSLLRFLMSSIGMLRYRLRLLPSYIKTMQFVRTEKRLNRPKRRRRRGFKKHDVNGPMTEPEKDIRHINYGCDTASSALYNRCYRKKWYY